VTLVFLKPSVSMLATLLALELSLTESPCRAESAELIPEIMAYPLELKRLSLSFYIGTETKNVRESAKKERGHEVGLLAQES